MNISETCQHLKSVARHPSLWRKLTLTSEKIKNKNEACRNHVKRCSSLRDIVITGEEKGLRNDKIMAVLMKAKNSLISIKFSPSHFCLSNSSIAKIGKMTQLKHLTVGGGQLGPDGISSLSCLSELKTLKVPGIFLGKRYEDKDPFMAALVDLLSKLKKLEKVEIRLAHNDLSDEVVGSLLNNNPNLHHLDITPLHLLTPCFMHLAPGSLPPNIFKTHSSESLNLIADKCPQLTHIGVGHLRSLSDTSITKLVTNCPNLKHANFVDTYFNDTALALMSKNCPDLEYLNIIGCWNVTEEALERFANPATAVNLKILCVSSMFYSDHLMVRIKQNLPNVKIVQRQPFDFMYYQRHEECL